MALTRLDFLIYGFTPTLWVCALMIALFGLSTLVHLFQVFLHKRRTLWMLPTVVTGGLGEVIGWVGRLWSSKNVYVLENYLMQTICTIISPTFLIAANFIILGILIRALGPQYSRLSPRMYSIIFIIADLVALAIQSVGGAKAATATKEGTSGEQGGNIMLGGICFQLVAIVLYTALMAEFVIRCWFDKPIRSKVTALPETIESKEPKVSLEATASESGAIQATGTGALHRQNIQLMLWGILISTFFIFVRSVYRTIELSDGWGGSVIHNETLFNVFDGLMILLASVTINILHPGRLLADV